MVCPNCGSVVTEDTVERKNDKVYCSGCKNEIDYKEKEKTTFTLDKQMIIKILVGIVFIAIGGFLLVKNTTIGAASYKDLSYKYDETTATITKTELKDGKYIAYYEYTYEGITYKAICDRVYSTEDDAPKNQVIQVNRDNPEDYIFGTNEEPKVNQNAYIIPVVLMLFGIVSIVLSIKKII